MASPLISRGVTWIILLSVLLSISVQAASPLTTKSANIRSIHHGSLTSVMGASSSVTLPTDVTSPVDSQSVGALLRAGVKTIAATGNKDKSNIFETIVHDLLSTAQPTPIPVSHSMLSVNGLPSIPVHLRSQSSLSIGTFEMTPAQRAAVEAAFFTDPASLKMRNQSPRFGPDSPVFTTSGDEEKDPYGIGVSSYLWGLLVCIIIGFGIGILQLLFTGLYMFCRCCCWRWCCKKQSAHEKVGFPGYLSFLSKFWPVIFLMLFIALACAFSIVGIVYNNGVSKTFSTSNQEHGIGPLILNAMDGLSGWLGGILSLINNISNQIPTLQIALDDLVQSVGDIGEASLGLSDQTSSFQKVYGSSNPTPTTSSPSLYNVTANGTIWFCDSTCYGMGIAAGLMSTEINNKVTPILQDYSGVIQDVSDSFLNIADDINQKLTDASIQLDDSRDIVDKKDTRDKVTDNTDNVAKYDGYRNIAFLVLFCLVFLTPLLVILGLVFRRGCPFKCNFCLGPFYIALIFILFGTHWMLGMFIGDACVYLDESMLDLASALASQSNDNTLSSVLNACLTDVSLVTALNLTSQLDFASIVQFPPVLNASQLASTFDFAGFNTLSSVANRMNSTNFNFDERTVIDGSLASMSLIPTSSGPDPTVTYTRSSFISCHTTQVVCYTSKYSGSNLDHILNLEQYTWEGFVILNEINYAIQSIQNDVHELSVSIEELSVKLNDTVSLVSDKSNTRSMASKLQPIFNSVDLFKAEAYCYFAAQDFGRFKSTLCDELENNIQYMTLALFIIGFSCFGITWCSRWSSYRVQFVQRIAPTPFNEHAWMMDNTGTATGATGATGSINGGATFPQAAEYVAGVASAVQLAVMDEDQPTQHHQPPNYYDQPHETAAVPESQFVASSPIAPASDAEATSPEAVASPSMEAPEPSNDEEETGDKE